MDHKKKKAEFLAAYDAHADAIFRFCALKVSNREVAADLTQEAYLRFWQTLRKGDKIENERAFLYTLARNLVIDWYRKKKERSLDTMMEAGLDFKGLDQESVTEQAEIHEVLAVMNQLDQDNRDVLLMRFMEGLSPKEIGEVLGESSNAISVRLHRAIKKVQELIHVHD